MVKVPDYAAPVAHPAPSPEQEAPILPLLGLAARRLSDDVADRVAAAGFADFRHAHHQVLASVAPAGIRLTDLAERARMTKQAMAELVADLDHLGYLTRMPDPDDRRAKRIELTDRGRAAVDALRGALAAMEVELGERISPKHVRQLRRALVGVATDPETGTELAAVPDRR